MAQKSIQQRKIRILQLVDGFRFGGAESKLLELIRHLDRSKYHITLCSLESAGSLKDDFARLKVPFKIFSRKHRFDLSLIPKLVRLMRRERIDIVQTTLFYADFIGAVSARLAGVPSVISWETISHEHDFYSAWHRSLAYRFAMKLANVIVAVSEDVKKSLIQKRRINSDKIETIHYGVNLNQFSHKEDDSMKKKLGLLNAYPIIGVVARLEEVKGHDYLIDALPEIVTQHPKTRCLLVGDGENRKHLEQKCLTLGIKNHVLFLGFRNDVSKILPLFDLFVLPSISEGFPNVLLEAMACSIPIIATNVGGIPEAVCNDENGKLVPSKDSSALKKAILELLKNNRKMKAMGMKGSETVEQFFSLTKQGHDFENLYNQLCLYKP